VFLRGVRRETSWAFLPVVRQNSIRVEIRCWAGCAERNNQIAYVQALRFWCRFPSARKNEARFSRGQPHRDCIPSSRVDEIVTVRASNFNRVPQTFAGAPQRLQQEALGNYKIQHVSIRAGIWFGSRRPVVQIHSPRPFFQAVSRTFWFSRQSTLAELENGQRRTFQSPNDPAPQLRFAGHIANPLCGILRGFDPARRKSKTPTLEHRAMRHPQNNLGSYG